MKNGSQSACLVILTYL